MAKLLIVEDDLILSGMMREWLEFARHTIEEAHNGPDALDLMKHYQFDAVILDIGLPGTNGIDVLSSFRSQGGQIPILILTAKKSINDKERGFSAGADDYLTKPFDMRELSLRLGALLRRSPAFRTTTLKCGDLMLDTASAKVYKAGQELHLTQTEYSLLEFIMRFPNHVFTADDLLNYVWKSDSTATGIGVRTCINRLRKKLGINGKDSLIATVYGQGYRFEPGELKSVN